MKSAGCHAVFWEMWDLKYEMARREGMDVRPTIAVTKAHIQVNTPTLTSQEGQGRLPCTQHCKERVLAVDSDQ